MHTPRPTRWLEWLVGGAAISLIGSLGAISGASLPAPVAAEPVVQALADGQHRDEFAGAAACRRCHPSAYEEWAGSRHSRMVRRASPEEIRARFGSGESLSYRGRSFTFERDGAEYTILETLAGGRVVRHPIEYVLGNRRIQHFLTRRDDGALLLLPPTWDVLRGGWFPHEEIVPTGNENIEPVQVWDKNCFGCHVSQQRKNFDASALSYDGDWLDPGTNCETCHGPAQWHVDYYEATVAGRRPPPPPADRGIDKRPLLPFAGAASVEACASCHQNRYLIQAGYEPGKPFFDYFLTALPYSEAADAPDPGFYADGRPRRFSNNSYGLWQASCYLQGELRCIDCHRNGHAINIEDNPQLLPEAAGAALCGRCHESLVDDIAAHSRHAAGQGAPTCLDCHMPYSVSGVKARMRDHSLQVPVPSNTRDYDVPNACSECHARESVEWAVDSVRSWYGGIETRPSTRRLRRRASAFSGAARQDAAALEPLLEIVRDADEPFVIRAAATGYLRQYESRDALIGLWEALADPDELVRAIAPLSVAAHPQGRTILGDLLSPLTDPSHAVRVNTAFALATMGVGEAQGVFAEPLRRAQDEYLTHALLYADSVADQANRGAMLALRGEPAEAVSAYRTALALQPDHADARFGLARALLQNGAPQRALEELELLRRQVPEYPGAAELLARLGAGGGR